MAHVDNFIKDPRCHYYRFFLTRFDILLLPKSIFELNQKLTGKTKWLAVKTTCFTQYLSYLNPKGEDSSSNIDEFIATYISKTKWAWQA
jgi:hypothetical protein